MIWLVLIAIWESAFRIIGWRDYFDYASLERQLAGDQAKAAS